MSNFSRFLNQFKWFYSESVNRFVDFQQWYTALQAISIDSELTIEKAKAFSERSLRLFHTEGLECDCLFSEKDAEKEWYYAERAKPLKITITNQLFFLAQDTPVYLLEQNNPLIKHILKNSRLNKFDKGYLFSINEYYFIYLFYNANGGQNDVSRFVYDILINFCNNLRQQKKLNELELQIQKLKNEQIKLVEKHRQAERGLRRRTYEITNIVEISNELYSILDLKQLMNSAMLILIGQLGCEKTFALLNQPEEGKYTEHFSKGFGSEAAELFVEWSHPLVEYLTRRKQPVYADDLAQIPELAVFAEQLVQEKIFIIAPLIYSDRMLGFIGCGQKLFGTEFDENDIQMFSILVNIISVSISNAYMYENVKKLSLTDAMTDLNNYRSFEARLKEEINRARRKDSCVSLLMLDIDHFKNYNDNLGHQAGDEALRRLGRMLKNVSRDEDIVNRYGGEEFSIVLPDLPKDSIHVLAERIRKQVEIESFYRQDVQPGRRLTISIGGATFPDDANDFDQLVNCADKALYLSKQSGRNKFTLYQ